MTKTKRILSVGVLVGAAVMLSGCTIAEPSSLQKTTAQLEETQNKLIERVPVPVIQNSQTRKAVSERAKLFDAENKITYIYLVSFGKVMSFYPVKGQVVSLRSYLTPVETITNSRGTPCSIAATNETSDPSCGSSGGYVVAAPDIDGTYGENADGIFFFTADTNAYVEWKGDYMVSDQPLTLVTQPELIREIK